MLLININLDEKLILTINNQLVEIIFRKNRTDFSSKLVIDAPNNIKIVRKEYMEKAKSKVELTAQAMEAREKLKNRPILSLKKKV